MSELVATLLKYLAALVAVAVVLAGGAYVFQAGNASTHASDLAGLTGKVQTLYNSQALFTSLSNAVVSKFAPTSMKGAGNAINNPWGGAVTYAPNTNTALFDVTTAGIPDRECSSVAKAVSGYKNLSINGTSFAGTAAADAAAISDACGTAGNDQNTLVFTYGH